VLGEPALAKLALTEFDLPPLIGQFGVPNESKTMIEAIMRILTGESLMQALAPLAARLQLYTFQRAQGLYTGLLLSANPTRRT
jgi:hypothetical protein